MTSQNLNHLYKEQSMKTIKLASKTVTIAALLLTTCVAQATPTTGVDILWQWLFPAETQSELKHCPAYPICHNVVAPAPESTTDE